MQMITRILLILSALFCITYAYPVRNELAERDLNTAETIWELFNQGGSRGYSGWGTGVQPSPVVPASPVLANYPASYGAYPNYANYANNYYQKYPAVAAPTAYTGYAGGFPTYENYAIHGGHGFGKYGKY